MSDTKRIAALKAYRDGVADGSIVPTKPKTLMEKWEQAPTKLRPSVNAMCYQCMGGDDGDNVMQEIRRCSSPKCALFQVRPYK